MNYNFSFLDVDNDEFFKDFKEKRDEMKNYLFEIKQKRNELRDAIFDN